MMIGQSLILHALGRKWRLGGVHDTPEKRSAYHSILRLFQDHPSAPLSIHSLVKQGNRRGRVTGEWYGPTSAAIAFRDAIDHSDDPLFADFKVYVAQDCTIYLEDVISRCTGADDVQEALSLSSSSRRSSDSQRVPSDPDVFLLQPTPIFEDQGTEVPPQPSRARATTIKIPKLDHCSNICLCKQYDTMVDRLESVPDEPWKSVLLLIPLRLGMMKPDPTYLSCVQRFLSLPYCAGIIGGRPSHSLYFVGYQGDNIIDLDPHFVQPALRLAESSGEPSAEEATCHSSYPRKIPYTKIDPSMCLGLYLKDKQALVDLLLDVRRGRGPGFSPNPSRFPLFNFSTGSVQDSLISEEYIIL
ncbi:unnamed protein product [Cyprideis torosa]|uniref:Cysteine protease n=1 Tax=Cyprideis torosa TaxID=163714 RepID=A0A7R8ZN24_9CRUS|nr:unnamed protein product [Cyprideis torosa]CAG0886876.1 unnamed protein product [Cyprideis torosa]